MTPLIMNLRDMLVFVFDKVPTTNEFPSSKSVIFISLIICSWHRYAPIPSGKKGKVSERTLRKDTESFRKTFGKVRKEFGKNSDSDCFRTLCDFTSEFFPNVPWTKCFRRFPISFRTSHHRIHSERFRIFSEVSHYVGSNFFLKL